MRTFFQGFLLVVVFSMPLFISHRSIAEEGISPFELTLRPDREGPHLIGKDEKGRPILEMDYRDGEPIDLILEVKNISGQTQALLSDKGVPRDFPYEVRVENVSQNKGEELVPPLDPLFSWNMPGRNAIYSPYIPPAPEQLEPGRVYKVNVPFSKGLLPYHFSRLRVQVFYPDSRALEIAKFVHKFSFEEKMISSNNLFIHMNYENNEPK